MYYKYFDLIHAKFIMKLTSKTELCKLHVVEFISVSHILSTHIDLYSDPIDMVYTDICIYVDESLVIIPCLLSSIPSCIYSSSIFCLKFIYAVINHIS